MKNQLQISIPEPCQEDWDKMIPTEQGRLCDACNKCVVDFTRFSDDELLAYFSNPPKNVCGRFDVKKLNTVISSPQKIHSPLAKRLFWGLAMVAGIGTTLKAQTTITKTYAEIMNNLNLEKPIKILFFFQTAMCIQLFNNNKFINIII